jgi:hypothetical protein
MSVDRHDAAALEQEEDLGLLVAVRAQRRTRRQACDSHRRAIWSNGRMGSIVSPR